MTRHSFATSLGVVSALLTGVALAAQQPEQLRGREALARLLTLNASRTQSLEAFGQDVMRQVLRLAARRLATEQTNLLTIQVPITIRIIPMPRPRPGGIPRPQLRPEDIDVCWETTAGLQEYIQCSASDLIPDPDLGRRLATTCEQLFARYFAAASPLERLQVLLELYENDCLTLQFEERRITLVPR